MTWLTLRLLNVITDQSLSAFTWLIARVGMTKHNMEIPEITGSDNMKTEEKTE